MKQYEITEFLENNYPPNLASHFDIGKIGLQFGSENKEINNIMIALDATSEVIDEAIEEGCDLLITHHPFMFMPILSIDYDSPFGKNILKIFANQLNVYSIHTNFDTAIGGMNDILASILNLSNVKTEKEEIDCNCFIRVGEIAPTNLSNYVSFVTRVFHEETVRYIGNENKIIKRVGIVGGAGASELKTALNLGCDCLITGEVKHNQAIDALEAGISIIEVSHSVEGIFKVYLQEKLKKTFPNCKILISNWEKKPFKTYVLNN